VNIGAIVRRAQKATADNAPTILTALGVTGLITTAVLTGKASFKAAEVMAVNHHKLVDDEFEPLPDFEKAKIVFPDVWKFYIPAVGTGAVSIACIISANHISTRRTAALASAYSIAQEGFREYKEKVLDKIGEVKEQAVRDEIAQDRVDKNPPSEVVFIGHGEVLCLDMHSGRYFLSDLESIRKAENDTNWQILNNDYASLTDFWDRLGLDNTSESDNIGWNTDAKLELEIGSALAKDGRPCIAVGFGQTIPVRGYWSAH
jgi:hypothetical protein